MWHLKWCPRKFRDIFVTDDRKAAETASTASSPTVVESPTALPTPPTAQEQHNKIAKERSPMDTDKKAKCKENIALIFSFSLCIKDNRTHAM